MYFFNNSPHCPTANSPLSKHRDQGFYASPTSTVASRASRANGNSSNAEGINSNNTLQYHRNNSSSSIPMTMNSVMKESRKSSDSLSSSDEPPPPAYQSSYNSSHVASSGPRAPDSPTERSVRSAHSHSSHTSHETKYSEIMKYLEKSCSANSDIGLGSGAGASSSYSAYGRQSQSNNTRASSRTFVTDPVTPSSPPLRGFSEHNENGRASSMMREDFMSDEMELPDEERLGMSTYGEESTATPYANDGYTAFDDDEEEDGGVTIISSMSLSPLKAKQQNSRVRSGSGRDTRSSTHGRETGIQSSSNKSYGGSTTGKTYVWDEWNNGNQGYSNHSDDISSRAYTIGNTSASALASDTATYFSLTAAQQGMCADGLGGKLSSADTAASGTTGSSTLMTVITQVKQKVSNITDRLNITKQKAQALHVELVRVNTARKRRLLKFKQEWEGRLATQREEQSQATKKISDFCQRLETDVRSLQSKIESLEKKNTSMDNQKDNILNLTSRELEARARQARKQWDAEEKQVFEKALKEKTELFKKQAAESFGPELDKLVVDGKIKVRERRDECAIRLQKLQSQLNIDVANKVTAAKDALKDQLRVDDDKARRLCERKLATALEEQEQETERLKAKYERERRLLDSSIEQARRAHAEVALEGIRDVRASENKQLTALLAQQQRDLGQLAAQHADALVRIQEDIQLQNDHTVQHLRAQMSQEAEERREKSRAAAQIQAKAETERILARLREDTAIEHEKLHRTITGSIDALRAQTHTHLETMQASEKRSIERSIHLKGEIEDFENSIADHENVVHIRSKELTEVKRRLSDLRSALREFENATENAETATEQEKNAIKRKFASHLSQLEEEEGALKEALSRTEVACANKLDDQRSIYADQITQIHDKVAALLRNKDTNAKELKVILAEYQDKCTFLQDKLDVFRARQYSGLGDSTEDLDVFSAAKGDTAGSLLDKLNIGNVDIDRGTRSAGGAGSSNSTTVSAGSTHVTSASRTAPTATTASESRRKERGR